jgi:putative redox protein
MSATAAVKPPTVVELIWEHELVLGGRSGEIRMKLDSAAVEGPSPMQALAFALAGCMAMDVVHVLKKGRHEMRGLKADLRGERAPDDPRRFTSIELKYTVTGDVPNDAVDRAIQLSRDKYCSVWHSMRQDIKFDVSYTIEPGI